MPIFRSPQSWDLECIATARGNMFSIFTPYRPRFPWIRLLVGAYFSIASIIGLLRIASMKHLTNPYLKPVAVLTLVAGVFLLGWGVWAAIALRNSENLVEKKNQ